MISLGDREGERDRDREEERDRQRSREREKEGEREREWETERQRQRDNEREHMCQREIETEYLPPVSLAPYLLEGSKVTCLHPKWRLGKQVSGIFSTYKRNIFCPLPRQ